MCSSKMTAGGISNHVSSLLEVLAQELGKEVQTLCDHVRSTGLGQPSFGRDTPTFFLPLESSVPLEGSISCAELASRSAALRTSSELADWNVWTSTFIAPTVAPIGGNIGHGCVALAKAFPHLDFIVQDTPQTAVEGEHNIKALNDGDLATRIKFQAHDFFQRQPVQGAGAYLVRQTLHNWDMESSAKILANVVPATSEASHMLIMEIVLPEPGAVTLVHERELPCADVLMMQLLKATERGMEGWKAVLARAGFRLKMTAVNQPRGSCLSVIDLVLAR
ncbi:O-methyltransferase [Ophiocordyceps sinensis CO18]|uniref:O-methyltransferase n=1 Tax=Ophiocordyceps sinensis (strain Co18 / CGMCC 3.14243) TaxID=911162 RepID=T5AB82_OPHSC|nr:O-methyltransferase [Ophiocordyceps sinensis CO18]